MERTKIKELLTTAQIGTQVCVKGWVRTKRASKQIVFITLNDGSTLHNLQIVISTTLLPVEMLQNIATGSSLCVEGEIVASMGQAQRIELRGEQCVVLGSAMHYPIQPKKHSFEFLREKAHLRFRTNTFGAVFRIRHAISYAIHEFFHTHNFVYLHTPIITSIDAEGAGKMFHVTTLDTRQQSEKTASDIDFTPDFFGQKTHLTVSGQLTAEAAALGLAEVYTFGPTFRAENSNTTRHLAEFWMVEPEMAFYDLKDNANLAERFLKYIIQFVLTHCPEDLNFLNQYVKTTPNSRNFATTQSLPERLTLATEKSFQRITYTEAIAILQASPLHKRGKFIYPVKHWGIDLQAEHERYLVEQYFAQPIIITDYPKGMKSFYMRQNDDGETVAAMDILLPGIGEVIGGSQREERLGKLQTRIQQMHIDATALDWYIDTRRFGTTPHSGFGLGLERLVQFVTGMENIRDVIPFPRTPGHAAF